MELTAQLIDGNWRKCVSVSISWLVHTCRQTLQNVCPVERTPYLECRPAVGCRSRHVAYTDASKSQALRNRTVVSPVGSETLKENIFQSGGLSDCSVGGGGQRGLFSKNDLRTGFVFHTLFQMTSLNLDIFVPICQYSVSFDSSVFMLSERAAAALFDLLRSITACFTLSAPAWLTVSQQIWMVGASSAPPPTSKKKNK